MSFDDNGRYAVTDDYDTKRSLTGVYQYSKSNQAISMAKYEMLLERDYLDATCRRSGSQMECTFTSHGDSDIDCTRAVFDNYAKVQQKIDECEGKTSFQ